METATARGNRLTLLPTAEPDQDQANMLGRLEQIERQLDLQPAPLTMPGQGGNGSAPSLGAPLSNGQAKVEGIVERLRNRIVD